MKNILEQFLDEIEVNYTRWFADKLYNEHPHKYNMYGLKRMLDVYGVKTLGIKNSSKEVSLLNYPCILHTSEDFVIGLEYKSDAITCLIHGQRREIPYEDFMQIWTGNALVVSETTDAVEPNYQTNCREGRILRIKTYSLPLVMFFAVIWGISNQPLIMELFHWVGIPMNIIGIYICIMLIEKQLFGKSRYGDKVCSLFHQADCNNILDDHHAKIVGVSWSEIGLGYFTANTLLLSIYPQSLGEVALFNLIAMGYGIWSIYYQFVIAKSWCMLCVVVQGIIWITGFVAIFTYSAIFSSIKPSEMFLACLMQAICIIIAHGIVFALILNNERTYAVQRHRSLKANNNVFKAMLAEREHHETSTNDSSILFGNPNAETLVTILSNPHCNPCARLHNQVEELLESSPNNICLQYIFTSFNEGMDDSSRYMISCYNKDNTKATLRLYSDWYARDKFQYENLIKQHSDIIHTDSVEAELLRHKTWVKKNLFRHTPTILVNGHVLPSEYELSDIASIVSLN